MSTLFLCKAKKIDLSGFIRYVSAKFTVINAKGALMKQDYEKPELVVYEDLSDVTGMSGT
ncbi:MAG: hypothetical protein MUD09_07420 [Desulfobacterales bacterium]|jgi:hypothetical protein|nr:hypothetical protein [Desulfobacterales bacterium]